jgi:hypothetical protein
MLAGKHGIPAPEVLAYFEPADGPEVLVLEEDQTRWDITSDTEIGGTVRRLHGLSPPALYTVPQGAQLPSSRIAELTVRRLNVVERYIGDLRCGRTGSHSSSNQHGRAAATHGSSSC